MYQPFRGRRGAPHSGKARQAWFLTGRQPYLSFLFVLPCLPHSRLNFRCCLLVRTREPRTRGHVGSPVLVDKTNGCVPLPAAVFSVRVHFHALPRTPLLYGGAFDRICKIASNAVTCKCAPYFFLFGLHKHRAARF